MDLIFFYDIKPVNRRRQVTKPRLITVSEGNRKAVLDTTSFKI